MKKIIGLDLGTTSIGWALVNEKETEKEQSSIERVGVRIIPLTTDEKSDFQKGKSITINADRTLKRGARRNLQRFKLRRKALEDILLEYQVISNNTQRFHTAVKGDKSKFRIWRLRSKAVSERIELDELAQVLFAINKKRGYKSNRKANDEGDGQAIEGMELAEILFKENLTPGELLLCRIKENKKGVPQFYRSDLIKEFERIWEKQSKYYPNQLTDELKQKIMGVGKGATYMICKEPLNLVGLRRSLRGAELKEENHQWRVKGLSAQLDLEQLVIVLQEINTQIYNSSGLLSEISDRSKVLSFKKQTIGQYLYQQIERDKHIPLKNQVFYRQDYIDEFEKIWETQASIHPVLTDDLKKAICKIIYYQRPLKSQKGQISICELENSEIEITKNGKIHRKLIGSKVCPKSSPLFQEFKIWQKLNDLKFKNFQTREEKLPDLELKKALFSVLNIKEKLSDKEILKMADLKSKDHWELNFKKGLDGNLTNANFYKKYKEIAELSGHEINWTRLDSEGITSTLESIFSTLGINTQILHLNTDIKGNAFTKQPAYQFWHLLYSYESDNSKTGKKRLIELLEDHFGFDQEYGKLLSSLKFKDKYSNLSTKAMLNMIPHLKEGHDYSESAALAGYNHSNSLTKDGQKNRPLDESLELVPKNSLRNPVVEKILNQMVNLVNTLIAQHGKPDEIRIELARELKKSAKEREEMTKSINKATKAHNDIREKLSKKPPFKNGVRVTRNDIIKYKLWEELKDKDNGSKTLYTNTYISLEKLFSREFDIEHIIPKARLFDDSFSNKTISTRSFNEKKGDKTGVDAVAEYLGEEKKNFYLERIEKLFKNQKISKSKYIKLKMTEYEIPDEFIERDLRNSQYIAKKAVALLSKICNKVNSTTGSVTDKLRQDWQLINVMKELNWEKYNKLGLTDYEKTKEGKEVKMIKNWTKRNDHRHHIVDAITVAFTRPNHVNYFNYLNARRDKNHKMHDNIRGIEKNETVQGEKGKRIVLPPIPLAEFRAEAKKHLEGVLVSFKTKNKVTTENINKIQGHGGTKEQIVLTPRGQLHKETIYGRKKIYHTTEKRVGSWLNKENIQKVTRKKYRKALMERLAEFENNPRKAFTGKNAPSKNPIWLNNSQTEKIPEKVKIVELKYYYTIRKEISPDIRIEKVVDKEIQRLLKKRLADNEGDKKKAFSNLEKKPIWFNKEKGISIKRVTIKGVNNVESLHFKKNHLGTKILDKEGRAFPVDFVSTGNNHHVAVFRDHNGILQEQIVSFFEAVARKNKGLPVIDKTYGEDQEWEFLFTMKQNEMFVFPNQELDFDPKDIDLKDPGNYARISPNLFRVQNLASRDYCFRHHLETNVAKPNKLKNITSKRLQSLEGLEGIVKVRVNHLGQIVQIGEYS